MLTMAHHEHYSPSCIAGIHCKNQKEKQKVVKDLNTSVYWWLILVMTLMAIACHHRTSMPLTLAH